MYVANLHDDVSFTDYLWLQGFIRIAKFHNLCMKLSISCLP